mmetsp:Transcript_30325/g.76687  ORF Transcript_30325/g.76687 Transcript_30325/m.76687 type:complete len:202 (-) Transcript_30325:40-645(-)
MGRPVKYSTKDFSAPSRGAYFKMSVNSLMASFRASKQRHPRQATISAGTFAKRREAMRRLPVAGVSTALRSCNPPWSAASAAPTASCNLRRASEMPWCTASELTSEPRHFARVTTDGKTNVPNRAAAPVGAERLIASDNAWQQDAVAFAALEAEAAGKSSTSALLVKMSHGMQGSTAQAMVVARTARAVSARRRGSGRRSG